MQVGAAVTLEVRHASGRLAALATNIYIPHANYISTLHNYIYRLYNYIYSPIYTSLHNYIYMYIYIYTSQLHIQTINCT